VSYQKSFAAFRYLATCVLYRRLYAALGALVELLNENLADDSRHAIGDEMVDGSVLRVTLGDQVLCSAEGSLVLWGQARQPTVRERSVGTCGLRGWKLHKGSFGVPFPKLRGVRLLSYYWSAC